MKNIYTIIWAAMIAMSSSLLLACSDDDDAPAPLAVNFTNTTASLANDIEELEVSITFSRAVPEAGSLTIAIESDGLTYGQDNDFFTAPLAENGQLVLPYQANAQSVSFKILKGAPKIIGDDGKAKFNIQLGSESNLAVGSNATFEISFSDDFVAERGTVELNGGIGFVNQAFLDFSKLTSSQVDAGSWDLGFYTEAGEFYVILNGSTGMMARPLDVNSLTMVSATDTTGFATEMITGFRVTSPMNATWTDDPDGDLEDTAFGEIAEMDSDNQVFIVKDAEGTFWKKVRVLRNGENYTLQYANIADSKIEEVAITKNDQFDFVYFSFSNGITQAAPAKDDWDIRYSEYTEHARLPIGETSILVPNLSEFFKSQLRETTFLFGHRSKPVEFNFVKVAVSIT